VCWSISQIANVVFSPFFISGKISFSVSLAFVVIAMALAAGAR
jgi:hypothetical protein